MTTRHTHLPMRAAAPRGSLAHIPVLRAYDDTYDDTYGIDWVAVERAINGEYNGRDLTLNERRSAVQILTKAGWPEKAIADRLNIAPRQVSRWKNKSLPAPPSPCGTRNAYLRHKRRGEIPCTPCRHANTAARAAYRNRLETAA